MIYRGFALIAGFQVRMRNRRMVLFLVAVRQPRHNTQKKGGEPMAPPFFTSVAG